MQNSKFKIQNLFFIVILLLTAHCLQITVSAQIAVKGETVWTMAGEPITNGVVLLGANGENRSGRRGESDSDSGKLPRYFRQSRNAGID